MAHGEDVLGKVSHRRVIQGEMVQEKIVQFKMIRVK